MKIGVLGARGMLGQEMLEAIKAAGHQPIGLLGQIEWAQTFEGASIVINCAGIVKGRVVAPTRYVMVNGYGPHHAAELADALGVRFVQVSTDCVFSGRKTDGYDELDLADAEDIYGLSKRMGEITRPPHLTIRTSFVGLGTRGLIAEMLALPHGGSLAASQNVWWSGHTAAEAARLIVAAATDPAQPSGVLHIPGERRSRAQLVGALIEALRLPVKLERTQLPVWSRALYSNRWQKLSLPTPRPFAEQLEALKGDEPIQVSMCA